MLILPGNLYAGGGGPHGGGNDLAQGHQIFKWTSLGQQEIFVPVGQLFNPVKYACGQFSAADRTYAVIFPGLGGTEAEMAFPVAVKMIFALFRKEFNGPPKALAPLNGAVEPCIGHGDVKKAGLPAKFGGRVGVRVGDELKGIKG